MSSSNSRRSSRIKLPNTQADSRDNAASYYPEDSLKLYGYSSIEPDDESDSGASSLPSSNGSTLNSSCASFDMMRCRSVLESNSLSPQRRPRLPVRDDQYQQQLQRGLEYSKFKNDSGTFTDAEFTSDQHDVTPTKSESEAPSLASEASNGSTMNSVVTVIRRRRFGSSGDIGSGNLSDRSSSSTLDGGESARVSTGGESTASDCSSSSSSNSSSLTNLTSNSCILGDNYELNTWDKHTIRTLGIRVREIERPASETILSTWSESTLRLRVGLYGLASQLGNSGMEDEIEGSRNFFGHLRVAVNLIRPVKLEALSAQQQQQQQQQPLLLPRGIHKRLKLTCQASSLQVVQALLRKLRIKEQPYKFALYEHNFENEKEVTFRKLHTNESPLGLAVSWLQSVNSDSVEECRLALQKRRIVLQENESCQVNWSAFTPPELHNFLEILHREQREYEERIQLKYLLMKREIRRKVKQIQQQQQQQEE